MQTAPVAISASQCAASPGQGRGGDASPTDVGEAAGGPAHAANPYLSPVIRLDNASGLVILQYRDKASGEQRDQIPSQAVVREYQERAVAADRAALAKALAPVTRAPPAESGAQAPAAATAPAPQIAAPPTDAGAGTVAAAPPPAAAAAAPAPLPSAAPAAVTTGNQVNALI